MQIRYLRRSPLVGSFSVSWYACSSVDGPSEWPSMRIDDIESLGDGGEEMAGYVRETGYSRRSGSNLFEGFLVTSVIR